MTDFKDSPRWKEIFEGDGHFKINSLCTLLEYSGLNVFDSYQKDDDSSRFSIISPMTKKDNTILNFFFNKQLPNNIFKYLGATIQNQLFLRKYDHRAVSRELALGAKTRNSLVAVNFDENYYVGFILWFYKVKTRDLAFIDWWGLALLNVEKGWWKVEKSLHFASIVSTSCLSRPLLYIHDIDKELTVLNLKESWF
ncbi:hypothetical protein SNE40_022023 [Patella caerulea]|uniref:Uncharacterized protein n=1 Tax=Patella caerulea TaxID=87958 RepID=A0AAN8IZK6_PATCE